MADDRERQPVSGEVEGVNHPLFAHPKSKLRAPLEAFMAKGFQTPAQIPNLGQHLLADPVRQTIQILLKRRGPNLRGLPGHRNSDQG